MLTQEQINERNKQIALKNAQRKELLMTAVKLSFVEGIQPKLDEAQALKFAELQNDIARLNSFIKSYDRVGNFLKFGPEQIPEDIVAIQKNIQQFTNITTPQNDAFLNSEQRTYLLGKTAVFHPIFEFYQTEQTLIDTTSALKMKRLINLGKKHLPKFFKEHPLFENYLRNNYQLDNLLPLSLQAHFDSDMKVDAAKSLTILMTQLNSEAYVGHMSKFSLASANGVVLEDFREQLAKKLKGPDKEFVQGLAAQMATPTQRAPRLGLLLRQITKDYEDHYCEKDENNEIIRDATANTLQSTLDVFKGRTEYINRLKDMGDRSRNVASDYNRLTCLFEGHIKHRQSHVQKINDKIDTELGKVREEKARLSERSDNKPDNKKIQVQIAGLNALITKVEALKEEYQALKITDTVPPLSTKLKECVKETKKDHRGFKLSGHDLGKLPKRISEFDKGISKELKEIRTIENQAQLDVVQKMQLDFLEVVIGKLRAAQLRMDKKITHHGEKHPGKTNKLFHEKKRGLDNLIENFENLKKEMKDNPTVVYTRKADLSKKVSVIINDEKKVSTRLTAGFFSKNARLLKDIEKKAATRDRKFVDPAIDSEKQAISFKPMVDSFTPR